MEENRQIPQAGEFYMHFKGKIYQIITVATHTETNKPLVIYQALYGTYKTYARPLEMFLSEVDHEKYPKVEQKYRFRKVELCENAGDQIAVVIREPKEEPKEGTKARAEEKKAEEIKNEQEESVKEEEVNIEPLLKFLDETDLNQRLNILVQYKDDLTETMLESMGIAIDVVLTGKTLEEKYYELDKIIRTKLQYEKKPRI